MLHVLQLTEQQKGLPVLGRFLREYIVAVVTLAVMSLHWGSAGGSCGCRPVVGPTTIAPLQRGLGIHHDVGGSCGPPGHYNSPQVNGWSSRNARRLVHTRLLTGDLARQLTVTGMSEPEVQLWTHSSHWKLRAVTGHVFVITLNRFSVEAKIFLGHYTWVKAF